MVWRLLKHYGTNNAIQVLDDFAAAVVAFDPRVASTAQVTMMEVELGKLGRRLADAEAEVQREHRETLELEQAYDRYLRAARILQDRLSENREDSAKCAEIEMSLARVLDKLEQMKPEIEREEREDEEVADWRAALRLAFEELGRKVRLAHIELKSAHGKREIAGPRKDRALEQDRRAREAAGLTSAISALSVALDAMNRETAKVRAETEALKLRAGLLLPDGLDGDPNIAAALAAARGATAIDRGSLARRLAALGGGRETTILKPAA